MTKKQSEAIFFLIVIAVIIGGIAKFFETVGFIVPIIIAIICIGLYVYYKAVKNKKRLAYLREKYNDEDIVQNIFKGHIWQGQTDEQIIDSIGDPIEVDNKVLKTKKKEIWKYGHKGGNRFDLRITLENDIVVGWDKKA